MKKKYLCLFAVSFAFAMLLSSCTEKDNIENENSNEEFAFTTDGATKAVFSVAEGRTVRFSRGNLEYNAAQGNHATVDGGTAQGSWRFAPNQFDTLWWTTVYNASQTYNGWIGYFAWGTSGWNSGAVFYQPWTSGHGLYDSIYNVNSNYYPGGNQSASLVEQYVNADWAYYNAISNGGNRPGLWRTLTIDEWLYLLESRTATIINDSINARFAVANVAGIDGMIIFPDTYVHPKEVSLPTCINKSVGAGENTISHYTSSQWQYLENAGCVFLPCLSMVDKGGIPTTVRHIRYRSTTGDSYGPCIISGQVTDSDDNSSYINLSGSRYGYSPLYHNRGAVRPVQDVK